MKIVGSIVIAVAIGWVAGCGPGTKGGDGRLRIQTSSGPVFDWDRCDAFGVKKCGDKLKVTSIIVTPLSCTIGGKITGERPPMWQVFVDGGLGAHLPAPVTYGVLPAHAKESKPAYKLVTGCTYLVQFGVLAEGKPAGDYLTEQFSW